jgi:hypothetical protein
MPSQTAESSSGYVNSSGSGTSQTTIAPTERRKSPRYHCTGSARLQAVGGGDSVWATFTDISMHGCYLETSAPYNVGTMLELKLEAEGLRMHAEGIVRVAYPGVGMGVSFSAMSEVDRARLRELLASFLHRSRIISRGSAQNLPVPQPSTEALNIPPAVDAVATLQAMAKFFESRHMMGRDEFLRILRKSR